MIIDIVKNRLRENLKMIVKEAGSCSGCVKRLSILVKITVISDQHLGIRAVFERSDFEWQKSEDEAIYHYCTQHIAQNVYKNCHIKRINALFK
jgi:hypothetical protein